MYIYILIHRFQFLDISFKLLLVRMKDETEENTYAETSAKVVAYKTVSRAYNDASKIQQECGVAVSSSDGGQLMEIHTLQWKGKGHNNSKSRGAGAGKGKSKGKNKGDTGKGSWQSSWSSGKNGRGKFKGKGKSRGKNGKGKRSGSGTAACPYCCRKPGPFKRDCRQCPVPALLQG